MTDRANRALWVAVGLLLLVVGGAGLSVSLGAWGHSGPVDLVDPTVVRWWRDGKWMSFASLAFIGLVLMILGLFLARSEIRPRGRGRLADFELPPVGPSPRGRTVVRTPAIGAALQEDLRAIGGVDRATAALYGEPGKMELRVRLDVRDEVTLEAVSEGLDSVLKRFTLTCGLSPAAVEVTLFLVAPGGDRVH